MTRIFTQRLALLLAASLATLLVALALTSTPASATPFCGGVTINNVSGCFGAARNFQIIEGYGDSTGVCIGYNEIFLACSEGAGVLAIWNLGSYAVRSPRISGVSRNNTVGHGNTT